MPKLIVNLDDESDDHNPSGAGLPSPFADKWREYLRHKSQLSYGKIPDEIINRLAIGASAEDMGKLEYFYHLLRKADPERFGDIPSYDKMDRRKL